MKVLLILMAVFFGFNLYSQEETENEQQVAPEEQADTNASTTKTQNTVKQPERQQDKIQVECVCPAPAPQEQVEEQQQTPQIFPDNAVFNITPAAPAAEEPQKEEFDLPPGYLQKLPPGFSNDQYKRIEPY